MSSWHDNHQETQRNLGIFADFLPNYHESSESKSHYTYNYICFEITSAKTTNLFVENTEKQTPVHPHDQSKHRSWPYNLQSVEQKLHNWDQYQPTSAAGFGFDHSMCRVLALTILAWSKRFWNNKKCGNVFNAVYGWLFWKEKYGINIDTIVSYSLYK